MPVKKESIEIHKEELSNPGIDIASFDDLGEYLHTAHRDDHYMFVFQQSGQLVWEIDFKEATQTGPAISFVAPGQVHKYLKVKDCRGWLLFVANTLVPLQYQDIMTTFLNRSQSVKVSNEDTVFTMLPVLKTSLGQETQPLYHSIIRSWAETVTGIVVSKILQYEDSERSMGSTKYATVIRFRQLIAQNKTSVKQVKDYASLLSISPLYLNEIVKHSTGFPASYWITQEIILEAKRLLYYTTRDVRQIAYELGYEDQAYFSRFFKKNTGMTALEFRNSKPSNVQ